MSEAFKKQARLDPILMKVRISDLSAENTKLQSRIETLEKALRQYLDRHDGGCAIAFENHCDCEFPLIAKQALEEK